MLRGLVIVIMAIDHVSDFLLAGALQDPTTDPNVSGRPVHDALDHAFLRAGLRAACRRERRADVGAKDADAISRVSCSRAACG